MDDLERDIYFLRLAYAHARDFSRDPYIQNGAIIVKNNEIIAFGANRFPDRVRETPERWQYPLKAFYPSHAEENAVVYAGRKNAEGATMYCPWFACDRCAGMIINAGIVEVVGHTAYDRWYESYRKCENGKPVKSKWDESIEHGLIKLKEAGVNLRWIDEEIGGVSVIFRGELRTP